MPTQPARIPLYSPLSNRNAAVTKDARLYNGYAEKGQGEDTWIYKRPGVSLQSTVSAGAVGRGVYNWNDDIFSVFGGTLYKNGAALGAVNANGVYWFTSTLGATPKLFLKTETFAYTYDSGAGLVQVTDVDYPATTVRGSAYLDGTSYVGTPIAEIHGSDFNNPQSWDPLNFLLAQIEPDQAVAIAKQLVYVICLKKTSTEVFYDAGNASGSPLGPVQGSKLGVGCRAAGSVRKLGDDLVWLGTTTEGDLQVMAMSKVHGEVVSTPPAERLLKSLDFTTTWSWNARVSGHRFYVLTMPASNITLCFDLTAGAWYLWTDTSGNYMPYVDSTYDASGNVILQHATNGTLCYFKAETYGDLGVAVPVDIYTPPVDGGSRIGKSNSRLEIITDQLSTSVTVSWSNDDYQTFIGTQSISLDQERPFFQDGGAFSHRAYHLHHADLTFFRIKAIELTSQAGTA